MSLLTVLQVLRQRIWILGLTFLATLAGALVALAVIPPRYEAVSTASIDPSVSDPVSGQITSATMVGLLQGNLIALAKSNQVAIAVVKRLNMDADPFLQAQYRASGQVGALDMASWVASQLTSQVVPTFGLGSNVLNMTYKGSSPQQAATMSNAFMSSFIDSAIALKVSAAQKASDWFAPQIDKIRADLETSRDSLARFQLETKLLAPSQTDSESEQLTAATGDLTRAKAELIALQTQLSAPPPTAASSNDAQSIDLQTLGALRSSLSTIDSEIARLQTTVGPNNPKISEKLATRQSLLAQMDAQVGEYRKKLKDRIAGQTEKVATLEATYNTRLGSMIGVQGQREHLNSLMREVQFHQDELDRVQKAASTARMQSQMSFSNISSLDPATPPTQVAFPKPIIVLALAFVAGLGLGVFATLIAEALDRRFRSNSDLEFITDAPLLGQMIDVRPKRAAFLPRVFRRLRLGGPKPATPAARA